MYLPQKTSRSNPSTLSGELAAWLAEGSEYTDWAYSQAPVEFKAVADFLRGKNGPKIRRGVLNGKRVEYFKGGLSRFVALVEPWRSDQLR